MHQLPYVPPRLVTGQILADEDSCKTLSFPYLLGTPGLWHRRPGNFEQSEESVCRQRHLESQEFNRGSG